MINHIQYPRTPVTIGQPIEISVQAADPITIRVACFVNEPPPPRYSSCSECSTSVVRSGELFTLIPDPKTWGNKRGGYEFTVIDVTGDKKMFRVNIVEASLDSSYASSFGSLAQ